MINQKSDQPKARYQFKSTIKHKYNYQVQLLTQLNSQQSQLLATPLLHGPKIVNPNQLSPQSLNEVMN